jgi:hypothetical protein
MSAMGTLPCGKPIHTAVVRLGVYPMNQALAELSVVPVLPATGEPTSPAAVPVPDLTTVWSTSVSSVSWAGVSTWRVAGLGRGMGLPSALVTLVISTGAVYVPLLAKVA